MDFEKLILGIDIGTSSVKISLLDSCTSKSVYAKSVPTKAKIYPSHQKGDEQDVVKILEAMQECLSYPGKMMEKVNIFKIEPCLNYCYCCNYTKYIMYLYSTSL